MRYKHYRCIPKYSECEKIYYGTVEGVPEIPMIEAKDIYDFEFLFKEAVDDYIADHKSARRNSKWGLVTTSIVVLGILVIAALTCPKKSQHVEVLSERFSSALSDRAGQEDDTKILGAILGSALAKQIINTYLAVDDYVLFSVGTFKYQGEDNVISIGAFGHIFTVSREELKRRMEESTRTEDL